MLSRVKNSVCAVVVLLSMSTAVDAQITEPFVDVLVAVSADIYGTWNPLEQANDLGARMAFVMANSDLSSGVTGKNFRFRPYLLPSLYAGTQGTPEAIGTFLLLGGDSSLTSARDSAVGTLHLGVPNYDVLILLVKDLKKTVNSNDRVCGAAEPIFDDINDFPITYGIGDNHPLDPGARENKHIIVINYHIDCVLSRTKILAHELGHLFGADHQILKAGDSCPDDIGDCFPYWPVDYNHPAIYYDGSGNVSETTLMGGSISYPMALMFSSSSPGATTPDGNSRGDSTKNVVEVIERTWDHVAAYRQPPQECNIQFNLCSEGFAQTLATAFWPGQSMTNVDLDYQPLGNSNWYPIYDGNPSCAPYNTPNGPSIVRALVTNVLGQVTSCSVTIGADLCGDGGFF